MAFSWFKRNPTRHLDDLGSFPLIWNRSTETLNGIALGAPVEDLDPLGRASRFQWHSRHYFVLEYAAVGLVLSMEDNAVGSIVVAFAEPEAHSEDPQFSPLPGLGVEPRSCVWTRATVESEITAELGEPNDRDCDEDEDVITYPQGGLRYEFEFFPSAGLKTLCIYRD